MSVYKDKRTGKWYTQFRYKNFKNEIVRKTKRGFETKKEAVEYEREYILKNSGSSEIAFNTLIDAYLEHVSERIKHKSFETKKYIINKEIRPYFGEKGIKEITPKDIASWQDILLSKRTERGSEPYSNNYLHTICNQMSALFTFAERFYNLKSNPAKVAGRIGSKKNKSDMKFWTTEEYNKFREYTMGMKRSTLFYAFECLYWLGIREGELLALTKDSIDFSNNTVRINKTYYRYYKEDYVTSPKSESSNRTITMPEFLSKELKEYVMTLKDYPDNARIFNISRFYLNNEIKKGAEIVGIPIIRVHDLRHSHVSLLIQLGYSAVAIAKRTGHKSINITYQYAHLFPSIQDDMATSLNELREEEN